MAHRYHPRPAEEELRMAVKGAHAESTETSKQRIEERFKGFVLQSFQEAGEVREHSEYAFFIRH